MAGVVTDSDLPWWKTAIIYQVYPRSFMDSNADGIGDIRGLTSQLDYLVYLGIGVIWISPFYKSPMKDFGYDVADYRDVDPIFGTLQHFDELVRKAHERGLKILVDFVPNHTSDQHEWFQKSCWGEAPYDDYYIWRDGKRDKDGKLVAPNNWLGVFSGAAWTWHEGRQKFYYHAFLPEQPDLNYRNPAVVKEMQEVVRFWMERGVDGMRVDALEQLFEVEDLRDEPPSNKRGIEPHEHEYLNHLYTVAQPEIGETVRGWRRVLDEFQQRDGQERFMVIETYGEAKVRNRYYAFGSNPFNHDLVDGLTPPVTATKVRRLIEQEYSGLPDGGWPTFVLGNHDRKRVSSKFGPEYVDALNMLLLTLKGTPCTYYGEEIGLQEIKVTFDQTQDPWGRNFGPGRYQEFSRDPWRSPMQWNNNQHAGFTSGSSPWLPVHPGYTKSNVKAQKESRQQTTLQLYAALARLRQDPVFQRGELVFGRLDDDVFSYVRQIPGSDDTARYTVILNLGQKTVQNDYSAAPLMSSKGAVVHFTCSLSGKVKGGAEVSLTDLELAPGDGLVLKLL